MLSRIKFEIDPLVAEILDQLSSIIWTSKTTTFLDPAIGGGQFVRAVEQRLREAGHSDANIRSRVFGYEESELHIRFAVNKYKLVGQYVKIPYDKFFALDNNMKFDVIVGNPPYQDTSGQNTIYPAFYAKALTTAKPEGWIAMITPYAIIPGLWGVKNPDGIKMPKPIKIEYIKVGKTIKNFFPRVSSNFCYFILKNTASNNSKVTVVTDSGKATASGPIFPKEVNNIEIAQSILNKCFSFNKNPYKSTSGDHGKSAKASATGTDFAVEGISTLGEIRTRPIVWSKPHNHYGVPKVMLPMYGKVAIVDYSHKLVSAAQEKTTTEKLTGHNVMTVITNSDAESESLVQLLESRLQYFFNKVTCETRSPYVNFLSNFIGVSLNKKYTNDELETQLGLSAKEKEWINANF